MENEKLITNEDDLESTQKALDEENDSFAEQKSSVVDDFEIQSEMDTKGQEEIVLVANEEEAEEKTEAETEIETEEEAMEETEAENEMETEEEAEEENEMEAMEETEEENEESEEEAEEESEEETELEQKPEKQFGTNATIVVPTRAEIENKANREEIDIAIDKKSRKERKKQRKNNKKRRGCCFNCCMSILVFNFAIMCVLMCVGWIYGNQLAKEKLDLTIGEVYGVVLGITRSNGDFIDNAYSEEDEAGFYDSIGAAMLLNEGAIDGKDFRKAVLKSTSDEDSKEPLQDFMVDLLVSENFNQDKLKSIGTPNQADTNLKISDRQLAAFIGGMMSSLVKNFMEDQLAEGELVDGIDLTKLSPEEYVKLEQIKIFSQQMDVDGSVTDVDMATVTASMSLEKMLDDIKEAVDVTGMLSETGEVDESTANLVQSMFNMVIGVMSKILPKTFYVTFDMGLSHNVEPTLYINNMGMDNERMNNLYKLLAKAGVDVKGKLNDIFIGEGAVATAMNSLKEVVPLDDILTNGGIDCDIYQLIIDMAKLNYNEDENGQVVLKPIEQRISSNDILGALKLVLEDNSDYLNALKSSEHSYKNVEFVRNEDGSLDLSSGEPVIAHQGKEYYVTTKKEIDSLIGDYEQLFLARFANSYGLDTERYDDMDKIIEAFSGDSFNSDEVIDMFDSDKLKAIIAGEARGLVINDKMLAALLVKMLPSAMENSDIPNDAVSIEYLYLEERDSNGMSHFMLNVGLNLNINKLFNASGNDGNMMNTIIKNIVPTKVVVEAGIDVSLSEDDSFTYLPNEIKFNGNSVDVIDKLIIAFEALGVDAYGNAITLGDFVGNLLDPVREVITNLDSTLDGMTMEESAIKLPNVYVALAKAINGDTQEGDEEYIEPEKVENVLKLFVNSDPFADEESHYYFYRQDNAQEVNSRNQAAEGALLTELQNKYGLAEEMENTDYVYTLDDVLYVLLGLGAPSDDRVEAVEIYDLIDTAALEALAFDDSDNWSSRQKVEILTHVIDNSHIDMLTALIKKVVDFDDLASSMGEGVFGEDNLLYVSIDEDGLGNDYLIVTVRVVVADVFGSSDDQNAMKSFISSLLDGNAAITLKVNLTEETAQSEVVINDNSQATEDLFRMLDAMDVDFDLSDIARGVRDAYNSIAEQINVDFDAPNYKMHLPTMFGLINDVVLDEDGLEDSVESGKLVTGEEKVKLAFKGVFTTSATVPDGETEARIATFEKSLEGKAPNMDEDGNPDYSEFIQGEVGEKYFINESHISTVYDFDGLFELIDVTHFNSEIFNIDGDGVTEKDGVVKPIGLAYTAEDIEQLEPLLDTQNLGAILVSNLNSNKSEDQASDGLLDNITVHSLYIDIVQAEENRAYLTINAALPLDNVLDGANDDMARLLTVDTVYVTITVDIEGEVLVGDEGDSYYDCSICINGMSQGDQGYLLDFAGAFGGEINKDEMQLEVGKAIYSAFTKLDSSLEGNYRFTERGILLCDIFTFIETKVLDAQTDEEDTKPQAEEVREVIQGMYAARNWIDNKWNYKEDDIVRNPVSLESVWKTEDLVEHLVKEGTITDADFGAYIRAIYNDDESIEEKNSDLRQFSLLAGSATINSNNYAERESINLLLHDETTEEYPPHGELEAQKEYIILSAEINLDEIADDGHQINSTLHDFIGERIFITLIINFDEFINGGKDEDVLAGFIINNLGSHLFDVFSKLTGIDYDTIKSNLSHVRGEMMKPIDSLLKKIVNAAGGNSDAVSYNIVEYQDEPDVSDVDKKPYRGSFACTIDAQLPF